MKIPTMTGPELRDARARHDQLIARAEAEGKRVLTFNCPYTACGQPIKTLAPPAGDDDTWDTLSHCPSCGKLFKKFTSHQRAWGVAPLQQTEELTMPDFGYLQHGKAPGPMRTERVRIKNEFGDRWLALFEGKWRRVHIQVRRLFIVYQGEKITIQIEGV